MIKSRVHDALINCKGLLAPRDSVTVTNVTLTGKSDRQPILSITVPVKKIRGATRHCYGDCDGAIRCEQTVKSLADPGFLRGGAPTQGGAGRGVVGGDAPSYYLTKK